MSDSRSLVVRLVESFGDADAIAALLSPDATWWITPSVGVLASPTTGRDQITAALRIIFGDLYADARTEIHMTIAEGERAAARFTMRATALFASRRPYENEYTVWIEAEDGRITKVWEYLDVAHVMAQFDLQG